MREGIHQRPCTGSSLDPHLPGGWAPGDRSRISLTLGLHPGPDQGQWVAGQLATGAGHGATRQEHKHSRVGAVHCIALQPGILECLQGEGCRDEPKCQRPPVRALRLE